MSDTQQKYLPKPSEEQETRRDGQNFTFSDLVGDHPVSMSVGAATGAMVGGATGMTIGSVAGPAGTATGIAAGALVGVVSGGLAGEAIAEYMNPTVEHAHWRKNFASRPYTRARTCYEEYAPAYQYGWESQARHRDKTFEQVESALQHDWYKVKGTCMLGWLDAKEAIRDAWNRVSAAMKFNSDN